jgi:hypothetical protein
MLVPNPLRRLQLELPRLMPLMPALNLLKLLLLGLPQLMLLMLVLNPLRRLQLPSQIEEQTP